MPPLPDVLLFASKNALLIVAALLPIINPPGGAPMFLLVTRGASSETRAFLARRIAVNSALLLLAAMFIGSYVLAYFGISTETVKLAGGMLIASFGWQLLKDDDPHPDSGGAKQGDWSRQVAERRAFYPLTFPLTVGPGSTAVALTLGARVYSGGSRPIAAPLSAIAAVLALALAIYLAYRFAERAVRLLGETGTIVLLRLAAFVLLCVGIEIFWDGLSALLAPWKR